MRPASSAARVPRHREIARRFARPQYIYVHGNHDVVAGEIDGAPEHVIAESDGTRLLFTHGHQHDILFRRGKRLAELGVWLGGWLLRMGLQPVYEAFYRLDALRSGAVPDGDRCSFQRWAVRRADEFAAETLLTASCTTSDAIVTIRRSSAPLWATAEPTLRTASRTAALAPGPSDRGSRESLDAPDRGRPAWLER